MSNTQAKSIALTVLNIATVTIVFASKAFIYILIALYVAGELMFAEYAQSSPSTQPIALDTDLAEDIAEAIAKLDAPSAPDIAEDIAAIAPAAVTLPKSIARPSAVLSIPVQLQLATDTPQYATLTAVQLRKKCSAQNIKWRNAHGTSKHLSKAAMLSALAA